MEFVPIDFSVELSITDHKNGYILNINERFSKFTQLNAVPDRSVATFAKCVFDYFLKFGIVNKFYSDRESTVHVWIIPIVNENVQCEKTQDYRL